VTYLRGRLERINHEKSEQRYFYLILKILCTSKERDRADILIRSQMVNRSTILKNE
jgi:hypothetical protein